MAILSAAAAAASAAATPVQIPPQQPLLPSIAALQFLSAGGMPFNTVCPQILSIQAPFFAHLPPQPAPQQPVPPMPPMQVPLPTPFLKQPFAPAPPPPQRPTSPPKFTLRCTEDELVNRLRVVYGVGSHQATEIDFHDFTLLGANGTKVAINSPSCDFHLLTIPTPQTTWSY